MQAAAPAPADANYGIGPALQQGGIITISVFVDPRPDVHFLLLHSVHQADAAAEDHRQGRKVRSSFWNSPNLREGATKLDGQERLSLDRRRCAPRRRTSTGKLTDPIDQHDWMANSLARSQGAIGARLGEGLAFLATVGSTAPFIGLFGTVVGIYRALIKIGSSGDASINTVAGPVGEALIMTALGLVVAVPGGARLQLADPPQQVDHGGPCGVHERPPRLPDVGWRGEAATGRRRHGSAASKARRNQEQRRSRPARQRAAAHRPHGDGCTGDPNQRRVIGGAPGRPWSGARSK